jgi:hypothetical protein
MLGFRDWSFPLVLPCWHEKRVVDQVQPTINLLSNTDILHPDILLEHSIEPSDYKGSLVFRSAVESIRGKFIATSTVGREALVRSVLDNLLKQGRIADYRQSSSSGRFDFTVVLQQNPDIFAAIEVKGGEGNSINISERPIWASEFGVWCHLDGAIVNQPAHGAHAIVNRLINELVRRQKLVDMLFFKDILCGTSTRPCPKYPGLETAMGLRTAPDIFLFPQRVPTIEDPEPPVNSLEMLNLPRLILELFSIGPAAIANHIWEVAVRLIRLDDGRVRSITQISHQGRIISQSSSRPWSI